MATECWCLDLQQACISGLPFCFDNNGTLWPRRQYKSCCWPLDVCLVSGFSLRRALVESGRTELGNLGQGLRAREKPGGLDLVWLERGSPVCGLSFRSVAGLPQIRSIAVQHGPDCQHVVRHLDVATLPVLVDFFFPSIVCILLSVICCLLVDIFVFSLSRRAGRGR